ncbi:hypothetical protein CVT25_006826 [Psilocybe cyanescens]|uniref:Uncharacterized protein n=1 Tax=Psilocybe cyanescens TaxID=93625 RepID=A0A409X7A6_PSICY|nr:hypothetical protein CVT25_006826 [Psilocybe cyanescens]
MNINTPLHAPTTSPLESSRMGSTLSPSGRHSPDRRETILSLVEMLLKNNDTPNQRNNQAPSFEDDRDVPSVDEHLQVVGAEAFYRLQSKINNLDKELRNFANAARQLGSSVAILSSAYHLRDRLGQLLFLYHENAADLFPRKISHIAREITDESPAATKHRKLFRRVRGKAQLHVPRPTVTEKLDAESFPHQFEQLSKEVTTFLRCLNEFPEFTDEAVNASILSFEGDLKYWASCLKEYSSQFRYPAVQRYIHDLSSEMGDHLDELSSSLSMFIEVGVPTIRFAQKHGAENLLNLSTVATFFSAVTATTMQFSFELEHDTVTDSVNAFWFASLVFSIGAAVNSLLGLTWKQAMYRSPGHRVPWWVLIWIKRSPLVFLVMSVACFSIGLCCFAYASNQARVTSIVTSVLTAFTSFGLAAVSAWFASERWTFSRHRGQKWLSDVLAEAVDTFLQLQTIIWFLKFKDLTSRQCGKLRKLILRICAHIVSRVTCNTERDEGDVEANGLPTVNIQSYHHDSKEHPTSPSTGRPSDATVVMSEPSIHIPISVTPTPVNSPVDNEFSTTSSAPTAPTMGKQLWKNAVRNVTMRNALALAPPTASFIKTANKPRAPPIRQRTMSSVMSLSSGDGRTRTISEPVYTRSRLSSLGPKLMELEATHDLAAHSALVRHMQFSPDGKFLATSSWDKTSVIFRVGTPFTPHRTLAHPQGFVGQVAWSPTGNILLTKMARGIKVWTAEDGVCKKTINRTTTIETITWFPGGDGSQWKSKATLFVCACKPSKTFFPEVLDQYDFGNMKLLDVAITPDASRLVGVGPLLRSPDGLQPSKSRVEKRLIGISDLKVFTIVYNVENKQIENMTPVLEVVRDITLAQTSRNGLVALISYEHKAPPQLWKLELVKDRETNTITTSRLSLRHELLSFRFSSSLTRLSRHTYMPKGLVDFAGSSYFGGQNNELVMCAGKAGDIHIWDRESGALLHSIRAQTTGGDLTCMAWNHTSNDPFMFATGSHDGGVRVWTRHPAAEPTPTNVTEFPRSSSPYGLGSYGNGFDSMLSLDEYQSERGSPERSSSPSASQTRLISDGDQPP